MKINQPAPLPILDTAAARPAAHTTAGDAQKAGEQFEALMLKQFLASAMPRAEGAGSNWIDMALEGVADDLAQSMPFGLAQLLESKP